MHWFSIVPSSMSTTHSDTAHTHSTGVRYIDYCHQCGNKSRIKEMLKKRNTPDPQVQDKSTNDAMVSEFYFQDILPDLNAVISTNLEHAINDKYRDKDGHCLEGKTFGVKATMELATPIEANQC